MPIDTTSDWDDTDLVELQPQQIALPISFEASGAAWSLGTTGFVDAWRLATGTGVSISIVDNGVNRHHVDLASRYDGTQDIDPRDVGRVIDASPDNSASTHGTHVAGIIAGEAFNDVAGVGAAIGATISASYLRYGGGISTAEISTILRGQAAFDVSNNSWGISQSFADNFLNNAFRPVSAALTSAIETGRGGLGTAFVFAAGNGKQLVNGTNLGDDANFHNITNSRFAIAVGACDENGDAAFFSSPGANLLLSAPGVGLLTSDGVEAGSTRATVVSGTSFAAPLVSSVIALMLEVNPNLGYRDIQEILALSSKPSDNVGAFTNGATHSNGGGLVFDRELGFGTLEAEAAVNLARTWTRQSTSANEATIVASGAAALLADTTRHVIAFDVSPTEATTVEWARLRLNVTDLDLRSLKIELVSPAGTRTVLAENLQPVGTRTQLNFEFSAASLRGEDAAGRWLVELSHPVASRSFSVFSTTLTLNGRADTDDDLFVFTSAFADLLAADPTRGHVVDADGGLDVLNFAAAREHLTLDLAAGRGELDGSAFVLDGVFERVYGTSSADWMHGGAVDETLSGEAGRDVLIGGSGNDSVDGGVGFDASAFTGTRSGYVLSLSGGVVTVTDTSAGGRDGVDALSSIEELRFADVTISGRSANDFNGNFSGDLLLHSQSGGAVSFWSLANGSFQSSTMLGFAGANGRVVGTGDFNGDGFTDVLLRDSATSAVSAWTVSNGQFQAASQIGGSGAATVAAVGDFNGDGVSDVLLRDPGGALIDWTVSADATLAGSRVLGGIGSNIDVVGAADFNHDGISDILLRDHTTGAVSFWAISEAGFQSSNLLGGVSSNIEVVGGFDFTGDNNADVLLYDLSTGSISYWAVNANGQFAGSTQIGGVPASFSVIGARDVTGDGWNDVLLRDASTGAIGAFTTANGQFQSYVSLGGAGADFMLY